MFALPMSIARRDDDFSYLAANPARLARDTPAVIDKLFDVGWIESQWTPTRSHLDAGK
jgi:hypothetical protein